MAAAPLVAANDGRPIAELLAAAAMPLKYGRNCYRVEVNVCHLTGYPGHLSRATEQTVTFQSCRQQCSALLRVGGTNDSKRLTTGNWCTSYDGRRTDMPARLIASRRNRE